MAIGDTASDLCMIKAAGYGIAFNPKDKILAVNADAVIKELDLYKIMRYIQRS